MVLKCAACGKFLKGGITCPQCASRSHHECVRVPVGTEVPNSWRCGDCQMRTPKGRDPLTPVRVSQLYSEVPSRSRSEERAAPCLHAPPPEPLPRPASVEAMVLDQTAHDITAEFGEMELQLAAKPFTEELLKEFREMREEMRAEVGALRADIKSLCSELKEVRMEMAEFRVSLAGVTARVDGLERRLDVVEKERAAAAAEPAAHAAVISDLQSTVVRLQQELNDRDQEALGSDLEIGHLPEERGESAQQAVTVLAAKLGVVLEERDVVFAERVGVAQGAGAGGEPPRARRLVVRLARRDLRDTLLAAARVRRTLTTADAGRAPAAGAHARIFVNERLSRVNRVLFARAREETRKHQWRYAWTKRGRIYVRQADGKQPYPIRCQADLDRVFGSVPVGSILPVN